MIKANKGLVQLEGDNALRITELSCIVSALYRSAEKEEEKNATELLIRKAVDVGLDDAKKAEKPAAPPYTVPNEELKSVLIDLINRVFGEDKKDE